MNYLKVLFLFVGLSVFTSLNAQQLPPDVAAEVRSIENGLEPSIQVKGEPVETYSIADRIKFHKVPGVSIAVIKDKKLHWAKGYGMANTTTGTKVDENTLFQAGSISKPVAALAALKLMDEGKLDLDTDVNAYLKKWKIPENKFTETEKVTIRRLLTHAAGMTVHGFPGYKQSDTFPTDVEVLDGKGNTDPIRVDTFPGTMMRYSGGGYTVMENVVEDITGMSFQDYMAKEVLEPMGMNNSTYAQPLFKKWHDQASAAYDGNGNIIEGYWHNYLEQAAAGLWTTPTDLAKYCIEVQEIIGGKKDGILSPETALQMVTKQEHGWGLGPGLSGDADSLFFRHGGKNAGFTNVLTAAAYKGTGLIIMTSGDNGGALIDEIVFAVSKYYDWGLGAPKMIETVDLEEDYLKSLVGAFQYVEQVPGIGDYVVDLRLENGQLIAFDRPEQKDYPFVATSKTEFICIQTGDRVSFTKHEDGAIDFLWNGYYKFMPIKK